MRVGGFIELLLAQQTQVIFPAPSLGVFIKRPGICNLLGIMLHPWDSSSWRSACVDRGCRALTSLLLRIFSRLLRAAGVSQPPRSMLHDATPRCSSCWGMALLVAPELRSRWSKPCSGPSWRMAKSSRPRRPPAAKVWFARAHSLRSIGGWFGASLDLAPTCLIGWRRQLGGQRGGGSAISPRWVPTPFLLRGGAGSLVGIGARVRRSARGGCPPQSC